METEITLNFTTLFFGFISSLISILGILGLRVVKGYDVQIKEALKRTEDLPAIREAIKRIDDDIAEIKKTVIELRREIAKK